MIIVEGKQRNPADPNSKASTVKARLLYPIAWAVTEFDYNGGECSMVRGEKPIGTPVESPDLEESWFEGERKQAFIYHKRREAQARRQKLHDTRQRNGGKLICEVPNCRFDFAERYGALGEGYAQVHHLLPLSKAPKTGREIKLTDLAIVCANCHAMIH